MTKFLFLLLCFTCLPVVDALAQNGSAAVITSQQHADPSAWRRNDGYMNRSNDRSDRNFRNDHNDRDYDSDRGSRSRYGNARVVNSNNSDRNNSPNNTQTNGITINNIYSVPTSTTTTTGGGNATVTTP